MGQKLHKLGIFAFTHPWRVISAWTLILVIVGLLAVHFIEPTSSAISIPGTDAQEAIDRVNQLFPDSGKGSGRIVLKATSGKLITDYRQQITQLTNNIASIKGIKAAISPFMDTSFISTSGKIAYMQIQLEQGGGEISDSTINTIQSAVTHVRSSGLQVETDGDLVTKVPGEILGIGEVAGVLLALVVLLITLGSLVAAGMPIVTALIAIGVSMAGLFSFSHLISINSTTPVLGVMLGLAVGIDYSLFIINKYRRLCRDGYAYKDAAAKAIGTAGNAVIFAALTVVIALSSLSIVNIPFMTMMGLSGAATIAIAALVSISLVPAMLGIVGRHVFSKKTREFIEDAQSKGPSLVHTVRHTTFWYKWGSVVAGHPVIALVISLIIITTIALPVKDLQLGLPTDQYAPAQTTQKKAYNLIEKGFGVGYDAPLTVLVEGLPKVTDSEKNDIKMALLAQSTSQASLQKALTPVQQVEEASRLNETVAQYADFVELKKVSDNIARLHNVDTSIPATVTNDGTVGIIQVIPKSAPSDIATSNLIKTLRTVSVQHTLTGSATAKLSVTGVTALQDDINTKLSTALPEYLAVVIGLSLILLVIAFRSILVPLKATAGFLLSVLAMFGSMVAVFQWGWFGISDAPGPIVSFIPIIAIGILFGLAMDYEFFLVSSMHEVYVQTKNAKTAVVSGFGVGSKVVTAAGIIMVSVFAGFIFNHDATIQAIGFGLAIGILVDAFVVRMTIVPAIMSLLGSHAWWFPKWLDTRLPHISIEGEEEK